MLALDKELLIYFENIFIKNKEIKVDSKFEKFIKHLQLPVVISTHQDNKYKDVRFAKQGGNHFKIVDKSNDEALVKSTTLKLMLTDRSLTPVPSFRTVNILGLNEKLKPKYGATYPNKKDKDKAQLHIKALLSDAKYIKITDRYIAKTNTQWDNNIKILEYILPQYKMDLLIESGSKVGHRVDEATISIHEQEKLKKVYNKWKIIPKQLNSDNIHDRYIETDKFKILLSSGVEHLSTTSDKDFTYVIEIK